MVRFMSVAVPSSSSSPPLFVAEFPEVVQSVSVDCPGYSHRHHRRRCQAVIERPGDRRGDTRVDLKRRLELPPLSVKPAAGPMIVTVPFVSLSSSWLPARVISRAAERGRVESDRARLRPALARLTASRRLGPLEPVLSFMDSPRARARIESWNTPMSGGNRAARRAGLRRSALSFLESRR